MKHLRYTPQAQLQAERARTDENRTARVAIRNWYPAYPDGAHTPIMSVWPREQQTVGPDTFLYGGPDASPVIPSAQVAMDYLKTGTVDPVDPLTKDDGELVAPPSFYLISLVILACMMSGMILLGVTR